MPILDIIGGAYEEDSLDINAQRCVNWFLNFSREDEAAISQKQLLPTPGLKEMVDIGGDECRGMFEHLGRLFVVVDTGFYELTYDSLDDTMTSTSRGTITSTSGQVYFAGNPTQVIIVDGSTAGYTFTLATNSFAAISDGDFQGGETITFLDSYFIYNEPSTATMYASAVNDGTTYDALDTAIAVSRSDNLVAVEAVNDELWAFGDKSIEIWYNAANPTAFPFSYRDVTIDIGCAAKGSVVAFDNSVYWLDPDGNVLRSRGYTPEIVSTKAITNEISGYTTINDAIAYNYYEGGHLFYVLIFPDAKKTWVFDVITNTWHERTYKTPGGDITRHKSNCYSFHDRKHFIGAFNSGKVYRMSTEFFDDAGDEVERIRVTRHGNFENKLVTMYFIELLIEAGVGLTTGQGEDPQIMLEISKDGGHTWGTELWRSMGKIGEYNQRVRWDRLGTARNFTLRFTVTDPIKAVLISASTQTSIGL